MGNQKFVYINIDGFSFSYLRRLRRNGRAGVFDRLGRDGILFSNLRSGLISITNPMQSAILCGAWSNKTHNFYQHYDKLENRVVKHKRIFDAENAADVMLRHGKLVASVHQFMLEGNPCLEGAPDRAYIRCGQEHSGYRDRFALLGRIANGLPVETGGVPITYRKMPDFTALYIDDIDSLGHNNDYDGYPRRGEFEERQRDIEERLEAIQDELADFVEICKARGVFDDMTLLIATDHGMTPFWGQSRLPDMLDRLNRAGIAVSTPENRTERTQIVALPYTIELSLYYVKPLDEAQAGLVKQVCRSPDYMDRVFEKEEMQRAYGLDERGPDLLLCPSRGNHFYHRDIPPGTFGAGHDSFDETSQHIFGMLLGGSVRKGLDFTDPVSAVDLIPTILKKQFGYTMRDSTGRIFDNWFQG